MTYHREWRRSRACSLNVTCIEVALDANGDYLIRDSKTLAVHRFSADEWRSFTAGIKAGDFDDEHL